MKTLVDAHDVVLVDLDGTVWRGDVPTDGAVDALSGCPARAVFVTDDASRSRAEVARRLRGIGIDATSDDVDSSAAALLAERRGAGTRVLVVGDRLDTDVAAANAAGLPSMLVLTGIASVRDVVYASPRLRPTHLARDLCGLREPAESVAVAPHGAWNVDVGSAAVTVTSTGADPGADGLSVIRALAHAMWDSIFHNPPAVLPGDDAAWVALLRWSMLPEAESVSGRLRPTSGPHRWAESPV